MIIIESTGKINPGLGLLQNIPRNILDRIFNYLNISSGGPQIIEVVIISGSDPSELSKQIEAVGGKYENLGYNYGIVEIDIKNLGNLALIPLIQYIELPKNLYTTDISSNRAVCVPEAQDKYNTYGAGVLIGFIDSGIDYTHRAFRNEDGTTRIKYIYDLSGDRRVYNENQINEAINSTNPYSIVNVEDITKHGTHVAGIACAGGSIDRRYYGVAPQSSIIMVKATRGSYTLSTEIMRGLKFLIDKSKELNMPLVVNISLSTNDGAHNGTSLFEQYISTIASLERVTIVVAAGNEGDAAHHVGGELSDDVEVFINVASYESAVVINLYKSILPDVYLTLTDPTGKSSSEVEVREGYTEGAIGSNRYQIYVSGPKPFDIDGEVIISITSSSQYLVEGRWKINLRLKNQYLGRFDMWLPISEGLNINTKFFEPTVSNTLGIPATVESVISVGSYNYLTNTISSFSGRGVPSVYRPIKPDLVAPGEGIVSTTPNNRFDTKSGTSMATPHVTGICALFMEWGIVQGNDLYIYGERLKFFLVEVAKRGRLGVAYPNPEWGYGSVCAYDSFEFLSDTINTLARYKINNFRQENMGMFDVNNPMPLESDSYLQSGDKIITIIQVRDESDFKKIGQIEGVNVTPIATQFAIVQTPINKINELNKYSNTVEGSVLTPLVVPLYTLSAINPVEASGALQFHNSQYLNLLGTGILVGIIDTGIDYLSKEFMLEDDTTRIVRIWDQTISSEQSVQGLNIGTEYTDEQINLAIQASLKGEDPYSIVPSKDTDGHGTMTAALIGARGINPDLIGAAPDCKFAIVKLQQAEGILKDFEGVDRSKECYSGMSIFIALRYLFNISKGLGMPLVIYLPLGTNIGSHDGISLLEGYIDTLSSRVGLVIVTTTGNQGDTDTHTEGRIDNTGDTKTIEIRVGQKQKALGMVIWVNKPDKISISITSPSGEVIEKIPAKLGKEESIKFVYEQTQMTIAYYYPDIASGDEGISIRASNLKPGIWQFNLIGDYIVDGRYWAWIPQRSLLDEDTKFLSPSQYTTLTMPSTSKQVIASSFYNQNNLATIGRSGRGYTRDGRVKPDISAGGVDARVLYPNGQIVTVTGASVGGAVLTGCVAQLLQWGIIDKNDEQMTATKIQSYLIRGAKTRAGDKYPNREWGYGMLDMQGVFNKIRSNNSKTTGRYEEYYVGNLFIRKPF